MRSPPVEPVFPDFALAPPRTPLEADPEWWGHMLVPAPADWWQGLSPEHVRGWSALMALFMGDTGSLGPSAADARLTDALQALVPATWIAEVAQLKGRTDLTGALFRRFGAEWLLWHRSQPPQHAYEDELEDGSDMDETRGEWLVAVQKKFEKRLRDTTATPRLMDHWWVETHRLARKALLAQALEAGWDPLSRVRSDMGKHVRWMALRPDWSVLTVAAWTNDKDSLDLLLADPRVRAHQDDLDEALMALAWSAVDPSPPRLMEHPNPLERLLAAGANPERVFSTPPEKGTSWGSVSGRAASDIPLLDHTAGAVLAWSLASGGPHSGEARQTAWSLMRPFLGPGAGIGKPGLWATILPRVVCPEEGMPPEQDQALACLAWQDGMPPGQRYDAAMKASNHRNQGAPVAWVFRHTSETLSLEAAAAHVEQAVASLAPQWDAPHFKLVARWAEAMEPGDAETWAAAMDALSRLRATQTSWSFPLKEEALSVLRMSLLPAASTPRVRM